MRRFHPSTRKTGACRGPRRLVTSLLLSSVIVTVLCGCGAVHIAGFVGTDVASVSGFVSGVEIITVPGANGTLIVVTVVTFQQTLGFTTTNFCGNVSTQFPPNSFAQVSFKPGKPCATIVVIIIN